MDLSQLDPNGTILKAIETAAASRVPGALGQVATDAYAGLKQILAQRFAGRPEAQTALAEYEQAPEIWSGPLQGAIRESGAAQDPQLLELAKRILTASQDASLRATYNTTVDGTAQGFIQGDQNRVTLNFGPGSHPTRE